MAVVTAITNAAIYYILPVFSDIIKVFWEAVIIFAIRYKKCTPDFFKRKHSIVLN
jgi:hypothetical protein